MYTEIDKRAERKKNAVYVKLNKKKCNQPRARDEYSTERSKCHIPKMFTYKKYNEKKKNKTNFVLSAIIPCKVKEICTHILAFDPNSNKKQDNRL